jgi:hypothetical protein
VWLKRLKASAARPPSGGNERCTVSFPPLSVTEYCGQAPSAPLYIREVPGSNPVLTRCRLTRCGLFSEVSPHHHIVVCLIAQIRRMLGQYQPPSTYHLPSAPILTVPIPNLPVSVAEKALESLSSPPPFGGE